MSTISAGTTLTTALVQAGDTSGTLELQSSGVTKLTVASTGVSGTLVQGTAVSASGTAVNFTGIPSWAKKITVMISEVSLSSTADILIQFGDSGGVENTGYISSSTYLTTGANTLTSTSGYVINAGVAGASYSGSYTFSLLNSSTNTWVGQGCFARSGTNGSVVSGGTKSLSATLDRITITSTSTDTFDAGSINIQYEG